MQQPAAHCRDVWREPRAGAAISRRAGAADRAAPALSSKLAAQCIERLLGDDLPGTLLLRLPADSDDDVEARIGEIGRASWRDRVCPYVSISVDAEALKKKKNDREK